MSAHYQFLILEPSCGDILIDLRLMILVLIGKVLFVLLVLIDLYNLCTHKKKHLKYFRSPIDVCKLFSIHLKRVIVKVLLFNLLLGLSAPRPILLTLLGPGK